jgi:hypothetical protein
LDSHCLVRHWSNGQEAFARFLDTVALCFDCSRFHGHYSVFVSMIRCLEFYFIYLFLLYFIYLFIQFIYWFNLLFIYLLFIYYSCFSYCVADSHM